MTSCLRPIERAKPLLGTTVAVRLEGLAEPDAHRVIDEAFAEIALVHRLMSFHEPWSDVSRVNREACEHPVPVHALTFEVLRRAHELSEVSDGCFDITVAGSLVEWGLLPAPESRHVPDARANWRDIDLTEDSSVCFRRPLWIDLGGIAKGYAVDRAMQILTASGARQSCVNAGGDLSVRGPGSERVRLLPENAGGAIPVLDVEDAALASSSGHLERRIHEGKTHGPHLDGRDRRLAIDTRRFVSVVARSCIIADALTKIVLGMEEASGPLLRRYGASAHLHDPGKGWRHLGGS